MQGRIQDFSHISRTLKTLAMLGASEMLDSLKCDFQHFPCNILKIVKHEFYLAKHPFSAPAKHLFSDLSELYVSMLYIE